MMRPISTDVARSVVCVLRTRVHSAKTAKPTVRQFSGQTVVDQKNYALDWVQIHHGKAQCARHVPDSCIELRPFAKMCGGDAASCQITFEHLLQ